MGSTKCTSTTCDNFASNSTPPLVCNAADVAAPQASKRLLASQPAHVLKAAAQASPAFSSLEGDTVAAVEASPAFSSFTSRGKGPLLFGDGVLTDRS